MQSGSVNKAISFTLATHLYEDKKSIRCFCEHENGGVERNGIICGIMDQDTGLYNQNVGAGTGIGVGDYHKIGSCELNEFCTGPFTANTSILAAANFGKKDLCTKGS